MTDAVRRGFLPLIHDRECRQPFRLLLPPVPLLTELPVAHGSPPERQDCSANVSPSQTHGLFSAHWRAPRTPTQRLPKWPWAPLFLLAEAVCHHSDRYSPARLIGRAFPCAADIVGHHHTGAPTMPRPASNGIAIYQINPSSRWAVGPYPCRCRRSQQRSPQRELRPKR